MAKTRTTIIIYSVLVAFTGIWLAGIAITGQTKSVLATEPVRLYAATSDLPVGETVYKISVESTGIYEITYSDLQAAGLTNATPDLLHLSHRGQPVAFEFIGDNDDQFESGEKIRFYGWAFDGSVAERQFVSDNVYWLQTNQTAVHIEDATAVAAGTVVTNYLAQLHLEEDHAFGTLRFNNWESTPYEPDSTFWQQFYRGGESTQNTISFTLPYPDFSSNETVVLSYVIAVADVLGQDHTLNIEINGQETSSHTHGFPQTGDAFAIDQTLPISHLNESVNFADMTYARASLTNDAWGLIMLNYITATYPAELKLYNHQLEFTPRQSQNSTFHISNFSQDIDQSIVWDITDKFTPIPYSISALSNDGGVYTHTFNADHTADNRYIVAESTGFHAPTNIEAYNVPDIDPPEGYADWIAITHPDFQTEIEALAAHRHAYSHLETHIVSIDDIANIYNSGFVSAEAIKSYLQYAYDNWSERPQYVVLVGDSSYDPRGVVCDDPNCPFFDLTSYIWSDNDTSFMPFYYAYVDRVQGLVASDYDFALLDGDDLLPDIAVGRLSVNTSTEARNIVNKIILYEENLLNHSEISDEILFVHDQPEDYDFRAEIDKTLPYIPEELSVTITGQTSLDDAISPVEPIQQAMKEKVNSGVALLNWRGHGGVSTWSDDTLLSIENPNFFNNINKPMVIISMDCLDGNFAYPDRKDGQYDAVSEVFLRQASVGTAAHWSSTGLGFPYEHEVLARHFYQGVFELGHTAIGDAIDHAKTEYLLANGHKSEAYSFLLQGDPAMTLFRPVLEGPTATADLGTIGAGQQLEINFSWENNSPFTASNNTIMYYQLPENTSFVSSTGNISVTTGVDPNGHPALIITFPSGIGSGTNQFSIILQNSSSNMVSISPIEGQYQLPSYENSFSISVDQVVYLPLTTSP